MANWYKTFYQQMWRSGEFLFQYITLLVNICWLILCNKIIILVKLINDFYLKSEIGNNSDHVFAKIEDLQCRCDRIKKLFN